MNCSISGVGWVVVVDGETVVVVDGETAVVVVEVEAAGDVVFVVV